MAGIRGPHLGGAAYRVGPAFCVGEHLVLIFVIQSEKSILGGEGKGLEFWHLLHRQAGSTSGVHGSGRFCLAHPHLLYWPLLETKYHQLTSSKWAGWSWLGSSVGLTSGGAGLGTGVNSSLIPLVPLVGKSSLFSSKFSSITAPL